MKRYYESAAELVGNTPLLKLNNLGVKPGVQVFTKLELWNPAGSVKDRTGVYMVRDAENKGLLKPGSTIVEATAGNMGLGIAFAALGKGYRVIFVVPEKFSEEKQVLMRALGAQIVHMSEEGGMLGAQERMEELLREIPNSVALRQFKNQANSLAHYETTGPEIWRDLGGEIDYFVAGAGSGGTYTGIARYLKEKNPEVVGVLADPVGSTMGGGEHAAYATEGIGNDFVAETMDMALVDRVIKVNDEEAYGTARPRPPGGHLRGLVLGGGALGGPGSREGDRPRHHRDRVPRPRRPLLLQAPLRVARWNSLPGSFFHMEFSPGEFLPLQGEGDARGLVDGLLGIAGAARVAHHVHVIACSSRSCPPARRWACRCSAACSPCSR